MWSGPKSSDHPNQPSLLAIRKDIALGWLVGEQQAAMHRVYIYPIQPGKIEYFLSLQSS